MDLTAMLQWSRLCIMQSCSFIRVFICVHNNSTNQSSHCSLPISKILIDGTNWAAYTVLVLPCPPTCILYMIIETTDNNKRLKTRKDNVQYDIWHIKI